MGSAPAVSHRSHHTLIIRRCVFWRRQLPLDTRDMSRERPATESGPASPRETSPSSSPRSQQSAVSEARAEQKKQSAHEEKCASEKRDDSEERRRPPSSKGKRSRAEQEEEEHDVDSDVREGKEKRRVGSEGLRGKKVGEGSGAGEGSSSLSVVCKGTDSGQSVTEATPGSGNTSPSSARAVGATTPVFPNESAYQTGLISVYDLQLKVWY